MGRTLPTECAPRRARASQTVAFVAAGGAWALDPDSGRLTCMFEIGDPGPFAWGPQGDRVLLGEMTIRSLGGSDAVIDAPQANVFDWGRPIGKSVVFREDAATRKYVLADDDLYDLTKMPGGPTRTSRTTQAGSRSRCPRWRGTARPRSS